jgi:alpha-tubulin suppressor-like RCC1 family protein
MIDRRTHDHMTMIPRSRLLTAAVTLLAGAALTTCGNELAPTGLQTVTLTRAAGWPDALAVNEITTVLADVTTESGAQVLGVELSWTSSDSSIVRVTRPDTGATPTEAERLSIGQRAILTTHAPGTATITARLTREGFAPAELRVPVVVTAGSWPALLTVGDLVTVVLEASHADAAVLGDRTYGWQSSDPSVLQVTPVGGNSSQAQLTARASGSARVTLTLTGPQLGHAEFSQNFSVGSVQIAAQPAWPSLLPVSDVAQLAVVVSGADSTPIPGAKVRWSSTNLSAFTVDSNGVVTALSRGGGEVVASVGAAPFQVAEFRATLQIVEKWSAVSAGGYHTCAIAAGDGTGYCWGSNYTGELGLGFAASAIFQVSRPRRIATAHKFTELTAGAEHTCGREGSQTLLCWGARVLAQLGDGQCDPSGMGSTCFASTESPVAIVSGGVLGSGQVHVDQVIAGGTFTCLVDVNAGGGSFAKRKLRCWGVSDFFSRGVYFALTAATAPELDPGTDISSLVLEAAAGYWHLCVKTDTGRRLQCMGVNNYGQLGDGLMDNERVPSPFTWVGGPLVDPPNGDGEPTHGITAGRDHTCALDDIGALCWGSNASGQLGNPVAGLSLYPVRAALPAPVVSVAAGDQHTCALIAGGEAWCWGANSNGQLGRGTIGGSSPTPAAVGGGLSFVALTAGTAHTCGRTTNGSLYCWGGNAFGQLGDGTQSDRATPVRVAEAP